VIEMGRRDASRWLRRHPGFWCSDASHDLPITASIDYERITEQERLNEFRTLHRS
jgi:NTE family protein